VVEEMKKKTRAKVLREDEWEIAEELVLKERNIYVLNNEKLRLEVI